MRELKQAVKDMDEARESAKTTLDQLRAWRLAAAVRFTGKSIPLAQKGKVRK